MKFNSLYLNLIRVALLLISVYSIFQEIKILNQGIFTHSQIVNLKCDLPVVSNRLCFPIVSFTTKNNQPVSYQFNLNQSILFQGKIADRVDIFYDSTNPQYVVINNFLDKWFNLIVAIVTGSLALLSSGRWLKILDMV